jgi:hypothetical protein
MEDISDKLEPRTFEEEKTKYDRVETWRKRLEITDSAFTSVPRNGFYARDQLKRRWCSEKTTRCR